MLTNRSFRIRLVFWSLYRRRSRLLAAMTAVTIGATVLLGLITLCYDLPRQLGEEFRAYGANMVLAASGTGRLDLASLPKLDSVWPKGALVGLTAFRYEPVRNRLRPYTAVGTDFAGAQKTSPFWQLTGRWPENPGEMVIGADIAENTDLKIDSFLTVDGRSPDSGRYEKDFRIVGTLAAGGAEDGFLFMSLADMEEMTGIRGTADLAEVSLTLDAARLNLLAAAIRQTAPELEAKLVTRVTSSETTVLGKLTYLLYLVTAAVLALTMICVTTTMITVVLERRKEIGLKKALGAENSRIGREFLSEGVLIGLLGGILGSLGGLLFARIITQSVFGRALSPHLYLIPLTILIMAAVTVISCRGPVRKAVAVEPALVLRGE
ncbi:MAG: ABC transporter permease [Deltaproteobacteria bacterium]|jgi:putative ABC transport system permease protein|nr:ABC transporter permease [Deltaproteobacteria bacterium]